MIWIVLGGAVGVWDEFAKASALVQSHGMPPPKTIAVNDAGVHALKLDAWATLHPERFPAWLDERDRYHENPGQFKTFSCLSRGNWELVQDKWGGSSGLYGAQIALQELGATGVILCGCPLTTTGRHFFDKNNEWSEAELYRKGFIAALPVIKRTVRSMSGWTQGLLGSPDNLWLSDRASAQSIHSGV